MYSEAWQQVKKHKREDKTGVVWLPSTPALYTIVRS